MIFPIPIPDFKALAPELRNVIITIEGTAQPTPRPFLLHMLGVPGAGKTSLIDALQQLRHAQHQTLLGFDQVMGLIPSYQKLAEANPDHAFASYELTAREAGYLLLNRLIAKRAAVLFDNGGSAACHLDLLRYAQQQGYRVVIAHMLVQPDIAKQRIKLRQTIEGRHTPLNYIDERHAALLQLAERYRQTADAFYTFENDENLQERAAFFASAAAQVNAALD